MKLSKQVYEDYLKVINEKEKELADLRLYKGRDAIYQGDNWHDNPTLYQTESKERSLMLEIAKMNQELKNIEIIENLGNHTLIDIGDIIEVEMIFSENDKEQCVFKLVATSPAFDIDAEIQEVSINSPLGSVIYHKKVGDVATYKVNDETYTIKIRKKLFLSLGNNGNEKKI